MITTKTKKYRFCIGIDPGVNTGVAVWDCKKKELIKVVTVTIYEALQLVDDYIQRSKDNDEAKLLIRVEDARLRNWFGERSVHKLQGAGSIKRDCAIWHEFLQLKGAIYEMIAPQRQEGMTKLTADRFTTYTGFKGVTNEHNRDAAMLVYGI